MRDVGTGFETIGNATVIVYDRGEAVLVTDPWVTDHAYFGSWAHSHEIPEEQRSAISRAPFVWFSHGHPDHLNPDSVTQFVGKTILLADHEGGRIQRELVAAGHEVRVLRDRTWTKLSDDVRVQCIADFNQDSILLIDVHGRLIINTNDASDRGWGTHVRAIARTYDVSYLLAITGYGDADMINFFDEDGTRIPPDIDKSAPLGPSIARLVHGRGARYFIPFSSMHQYQRADSVWANEYGTDVTDHARGFESPRSEMLPPFLRCDCTTDRWEELRPARRTAATVDPAVFGDDWSERLEADERKRVRAYFTSVEHLADTVDFVRVKVGGEETNIPLRARGFHRGIGFEAPRGSFVSAVDWRIFDDLMIGNFMKTTLFGTWPRTRLYPDITPYIAKYADNGGARSRDELGRYFGKYRDRDPVAYARTRAREHVVRFLWNKLSRDSMLFRVAQRARSAILSRW